MSAFFDLVLAPQSFPFAVSLAVVLGFFVIELALALIGGSMLGSGGDGADLDLDADFDISAEVEAGVDLDTLDVDGSDALVDGPAASSGLLNWIGMDNVPFLIWLVSFLTLFGLVGLTLQSALTSLFGAPLPALIAVGLTIIPALGVTRLIASWVAIIMPKTETTATPIRALRGCYGTITQGTASRGKSAEVKIKDRHDNIHYLRVEPARDEAVFPEGSFVVLVRKSGNKFYVI